MGFSKLGMCEQVLFNHIKLDTHPQIHGFLNMYYNNQFGKKWKIRVSEVYSNKQGHSFLAWSFIFFYNPGLPPDD